MTSVQHSWRFLLSPHEAWDAMYEDCAKATQSIEFEQYIIENDSVGQRFMQLFIDKAAQGVKVYVIADRFGSAGFYKTEFVRKLRQMGGQFYFYNVISHWDIFRPWRWFPRTHIKTLLIDSQIAYVGGVCLAEHMQDWRDTQLRIEGPVVEQVRAAFDLAAGKTKHKWFVWHQRKIEFSDQEFVYLQNYPLRSSFVIYRELVKAISEAKHSIYISSPFFAPNRRFRRLLHQAAQAGLDVRLLVPEHSDVPFADWVCLSYARQFLENGGRIFRYKDTVLHNKTVVVDNNWATVGSTNMDILSFFRNRESNLVIRNRLAVAELQNHFFTDLKHSEELTVEGLADEAWWKFFIGHIARFLKSFLWRR